MYLYGKRYETPDKKPIRVIENAIRVDDKPVIEYSPIFVSILYLTKNELIIYCAYVDITRGDLLVEEVNRFFLKDIVEITSTAETSRFKRSEATELFALYEKVFKYSLPNEMAIIYHFLRVTMTDGRYQNLPIGAPECDLRKEGVLDSDEGQAIILTSDDKEKLPPPSFVARRIYERINDAKAGLDLPRQPLDQA